MVDNVQITKNFRLHEFLRSQTAARHGIDMTPPQYIQDNLRLLCVMVLQPLRDQLGESVTITSGYRPPLLNEIIGGSPTSAHMDGRAADICVISKSPLEVAQLCEDMELPYDQLIHEFGEWVHVSVAGDPRRELLTAYRSNGRTRYVRGLVSTEGLA